MYNFGNNILEKIVEMHKLLEKVNSQIFKNKYITGIGLYLLKKEL